MGVLSAPIAIMWRNWMTDAKEITLPFPFPETLRPDPLTALIDAAITWDALAHDHEDWPGTYVAGCLACRAEAKLHQAVSDVIAMQAMQNATTHTAR